MYGRAIETIGCGNRANRKDGLLHDSGNEWIVGEIRDCKFYGFVLAQAETEIKRPE